MKKLLFILFLLVMCTYAQAQEGGFRSLISPGELTSQHTKYEGISNCTKCHSLGGGIPDGKCLDCNDKLAERIKNKQGVHAKYTDACIKCHTDHKGKGFKIVSLEKEKFDHGKTDYPLVDKHSKVECNKCHKKGDPYAGISQECLSCHKDPNKDKLGKDCERCHNIKGWKDLVKFNHERDSKYPLTGKHIEVKCEKCHINSKINFKVDMTFFTLDLNVFACKRVFRIPFMVKLYKVFPSLNVMAALAVFSKFVLVRVFMTG